MQKRRGLIRTALLIGLAASLLASCGSDEEDTANPSTTHNQGCPTATPPGGQATNLSPRIVLVVEENHSYSQIIGKAPFLTALARCGMLLTKYVARDHPSLPNYIRLLSGGTQGVTSDTEKRSLTASNLVDQLEQKGITWKAYMEGLPSPCWKGAGVGNYVKRHNPFMYFESISDSPERCAKVVPFNEFASDLNAGRLPQFVFITPDLAHDMHGADKRDDRRFPIRWGKSRRLVSIGDSWLKTQVYDPLTASSAWTEATRLVITFDEASRFAVTTRGLDTRVATIIAGPRVPSGQDGSRYNHYALLRSIESLYYLPYWEAQATRQPRPFQSSTTSLT